MKYDKCKSLIKYLITVHDCENKKKAYKYDIDNI